MESNDIAISKIQAGDLGGAYWKCEMSPILQDEGIYARVSYIVENPAYWINTSIYALRQKALKYGDNGAIEMLDAAQKAQAEGNNELAYGYVSKAQTRLGAQALDGGESMASWEKETALAQKTIDLLKNLSKEQGIAISFKRELGSYATELETNLEDANKLAQKGDAKNAALKWGVS